MSKETKKIKNLADQFLIYKRSLGYKYETGEFYINNFIRFIAENKFNIVIPNKDVVYQWLTSAVKKPGCQYNMISVIREFSKYLITMGYHNAYIIPPKHGSKLEQHLPYFFNNNEIVQFFTHVDKINRRKEYPGRELVIPGLFRLLYCCGLRCREARLLLCSNVNLERRYIDIIQSKGPKSRRIFISHELAETLYKYDRAIGLIFPNRTYFFPNRKGEPYDKGFISLNFNRIWSNAFPCFDSPVKPRAYDFRHHFAYANLNRWAKEGKDVNVMLAYLMRYMGHNHIKSTLYYFHFVPDFFETFKDKTKILETILPEVHYEE